MPRIIVDGTEVEVPAEFTVLQACEAAGAEIPRFCFHERLSIAGNCRMCLVEVKGAPKPIASCAMGMRDLRPGPNGEPPVVMTKTATVKRAREGVLEFLLINHPLDCPICDQGGECDLQDQTMAFGVDASRFAENKRAIHDKNLGPLVKTAMTRCIHCTRCIRFTSEVAGVADLGSTGRGEDMEITSYLERAMTSELQGNVIDLCPVGALLPKPYRHNARPWELQQTESVDVMDAMGASIRIDTRGREVMRIVPRLNDEINEEWISDTTRFHYDGLKAQRLDQPFIREAGRLRPATWAEAFAAIAARVRTAAPERIGAIAGDLCAVEEMFALKLLVESLGSRNLDGRQDGSPLHPGFGRASYIFNPSIVGIEEADAILLVGTNPRREAAVLNARIRKRWLAGGIQIGVIGERSEYTYAVDYLGAGPATLAEVASGTHPFAEILRAAKKPLIMVGQGALARPDGVDVLVTASRAARDLGVVTDGWNGFAMLHTAAARVGALDIGFVPGEGGLGLGAMLRPGALDLLFLLGADEVHVPPGPFVVYQGTHGDRGAHRADVILPGAAYPEKSGLYVNLEGRVQLANRATVPLGQAKEDWAILRALSDVLGRKLPFDSLPELRRALVAAHPHFGALDTLAPADPAPLLELAAIAGSPPGAAPFAPAIDDFYLSNAILRASAVMAECSRAAIGPVRLAAE